MMFALRLASVDPLSDHRFDRQKRRKQLNITFNFIVLLLSAIIYSETSFQESKHHCQTDYNDEEEKAISCPTERPQ